MSNQNDIRELRSLLFDALRGLKNGTVTIQSAEAMSQVGQVIINSAKMEVEYLRATDNQTHALSFVDVYEDPQKIAAIEHREVGLPPGIKGITRHRLR